VRTSNYGSEFTTSYRSSATPTKDEADKGMERPGFIRVPFGQGTVMLRHGDGGDYWGGLASRGTVRVRQTGQVEPGAHAYANLRASCQPGACFPTRCRQLTAEPISLSLDR
jgi:hypothetical protein